MSELAWRKSTYSDSGGGDCVEVAVGWTKSNYSDSSGGDCVEVAAGQVAVHVRDSKDITGPTLCLPSDAWRRFLGSLR
ncbi:DUF397 domain-containing protein [Streptomyces sp. RKND-216]|uniref:DUF397 domain-containing protein n=1 Tax=Streptomyces sp. RKND-216 TaxID=2562581 RepID=UPI00109DE7AD|nr:DUF397 domain-containing protein [Streptomyces sp. RKND-216]THA25530.1 DUF397 domain-containing protein [Streptomyces sp. RKND-216]